MATKKKAAKTKRRTKGAAKRKRPRASSAKPLRRKPARPPKPAKPHRRKPGLPPRPQPAPGPVGQPKPVAGPIEHVVIIVKENHCFDNYFGTFPGANGAQLPRSPNPPPHDPNHEHGAWLTRKTTAVRAQFVEQDIPAYFAYARQYTLCDNYFTDVTGPSTPNHLMLIAGDSPVIVNPHNYRLGPGIQPFNIPSLPKNLEANGLTWGNYGGYAFDFIGALRGRNKYPSQQFVTDANGGRIPTVSWVYAPQNESEHPLDNVTLGMQWTVAQVNAVVQGGLWPKTAIFITWDDWGGWLDHVDPENVEQWTDGTQFRYGSRVGCLVLSPFARNGYISKVRHSHVSLLKFCVQQFGVAAPHKRVAAADDMSDCFDFRRLPAAPPKADPTLK
jgi:phospholipase C